MRPGLFVLDARVDAKKILDKVTRCAYCVNMKPKYRSEKYEGEWYAMRGDERVGKPVRTRKEAEYRATQIMICDLRYEESCSRLEAL
jgi:Fe-S oxidoreductase